MVLPKPEELKDFSAFEDSALIKLIAAKQTEALEVLYKRHGRAVFKHVLSAVNQVDMAEKICLEVFLYVWENAVEITKEQEIIADWLEKIGRDRVLEVMAENINTISGIKPPDAGSAGNTGAAKNEANTEPPIPEAELPASLKKKLMHEVKRRKAILLER
jgi:DNA-directed RNA polymerase specialized sigma24 family protein